MTLTMIVILGIIIFLELIQYLVIFDVILSWLQLLGIKFRPKFVESILNPMYATIKRYIPTRIGAFDFTPIIIIFGCMFLIGLIYQIFPEVASQMQSLTHR